MESEVSVYIAHANESKIPKSTPAHFFSNKPLYVGFGLGERNLQNWNMLILIILKTYD
jgi:hypothetical protein